MPPIITMTVHIVESQESGIPALPNYLSTMPTPKKKKTPTKAAVEKAKKEEEEKAEASSPDRKTPATATKKNNNNKRRKSLHPTTAYKNLVNAGMEKESTAIEVLVLQKKLKIAQEKDEAAAKQVKTAAHDLKDSGYRWTDDDTQWMAQYSELVKHKKKHGTCFVSQDEPLGAWVEAQQKAFHEKDKEAMPDSRKELLDAIRFPWGKKPEPN